MLRTYIMKVVCVCIFWRLNIEGLYHEVGFCVCVCVFSGETQCWGLISWKWGVCEMWQKAHCPTSKVSLKRREGPRGICNCIAKLVPLRTWKQLFSSVGHTFLSWVSEQIFILYKISQVYSANVNFSLGGQVLLLMRPKWEFLCLMDQLPSLSFLATDG